MRSELTKNSGFWSRSSSPKALTSYKIQGGLRQSRRLSMDEKSLLKQWNHMRSQIIQSQVAPALVLIGVMVLASLGVYADAADSARYLTLGIAAITGILATISQYAAVREGEALMVDLRRVTNPSALSAKIADSRGLLSLSAIAVVSFGIAMFALVVWAVLGA